MINYHLYQNFKSLENDEFNNLIIILTKLLFIEVDILFYYSGHIILMCCICYFIVLKAKIKPPILNVL